MVNSEWGTSNYLGSTTDYHLIPFVLRNHQHMNGLLPLQHLGGGLGSTKKWHVAKEGRGEGVASE